MEQTNSFPEPLKEEPSSGTTPKLKLPFIIGGIILLLVVGIGSYFLGKNSQKTELASQSPTVIPTQQVMKEKVSNKITPNLNPTSVSSDSINVATPTISIPRIQTYSAGEEVQYKNNVKGFSFLFPAYFTMNSNSTEQRISFLQKQNDLMAQRLLMEVEDYGQELDDYAGAKGYYSYGDKEMTSIDGRPALLFVKTQSPKDFCNYDDENKVRRVKLALIKGNGYVMTFLPNDSCDTFKYDWLSGIIQSVKFSK